MILKQTTFMKEYMICNLYNNISGMKEGLKEDGYEYLDNILDDLEHAYKNKNENYLMNLLDNESIKEVIKISENYNILTNSYPLGDYKKIGTIYEF